MQSHISISKPHMYLKAIFLSQSHTCISKPYFYLKPYVYLKAIFLSQTIHVSQSYISISEPYMYLKAIFLSQTIHVTQSHISISELYMYLKAIFLSQICSCDKVESQQDTLDPTGQAGLFLAKSSGCHSCNHPAPNKRSAKQKGFLLVDYFEYYLSSFLELVGAQ